MEKAEKARIDLVKASEEIRLKFDELRKEAPGKIVGQGSKTDVIISLKEDIEELLKSGYTFHQIAEAINKTEVMKTIQILPRSISLALNKTVPSNEMNKTVRLSKKKRVKKQTVATEEQKRINTEGNNQDVEVDHAKQSENIEEKQETDEQKAYNKYFANTQ